MPFPRPTLTTLRQQTKTDIVSGLPPGATALLRYSNLGILGDALAGLAHLHYAYLDWIALQSVPYTATDEHLEGWAALKGVTRIPAASASGSVMFLGTPGSVVPIGATVTRGDGIAYTVTTGGVVSSDGSVTVVVIATTAGVVTNAVVGMPLTLGSAVVGIQSNGLATTALTGGADVEADDALRTRMLGVYAAPPAGGKRSDYVEWALAVPGVTRAWVNPNGAGVGTVVVYTMFDLAEAAFAGFPQGTNGVATVEPRAVPATGDQLAVANALYPLQPVTALVYSCAPIAMPVNFVISGIPTAPAATRAAITAALQAVFFLYGAPGGTVDLSLVESAIAAIPGTLPFVITSPTGNIVSNTGYLPVLGTITYA
jgi:uncharacterized phage protein gp47/JayE